MKTTIQTALVAAFAMAALSGAYAASNNLSHADKQFVKKAAEAGAAEVDAGRLATQHAGTDEVKKFGEHMQQDHSKANDELKQIAQNKGIAVADSPDRSHQRLAHRLEKMDGAQFDRTYMRENVKDHKKAVALFQKEANRGKDPDLRAFAQKTLPELQQHLQMAEQLDANYARR